MATLIINFVNPKICQPIIRAYMELKYKLLDHPFYKNWTEGKISMDQLARYGASYQEFIKKVPDYWMKVINAFNVTDKNYSKIVNDELRHIGLWEEWISLIERPSVFPRMTSVIEEFNSYSPSALLGALYAFETQQPEVARTKKKGLMEHYGFDKKSLRYFDEHMAEDEHIAFNKALSRVFADQSEFEFGVNEGSKKLYNSLDLYME